MHIHSATHHASSASSHAADAANNATAKGATSSQGAWSTPSLLATASDGIGTATPAAPIQTAATTAGGAASSPFASLSSNLQALLLGVGQNGQTGTNTTTNTSSALQAYAQNSLFG